MSHYTIFAWGIVTGVAATCTVMAFVLAYADNYKDKLVNVKIAQLRADKHGYDADTSHFMMSGRM